MWPSIVGGRLMDIRNEFQKYGYFGCMGNIIVRFRSLISSCFLHHFCNKATIECAFGWMEPRKRSRHGPPNDPSFKWINGCHHASMWHQMICKWFWVWLAEWTNVDGKMKSQQRHMILNRNDRQSFLIHVKMISNSTMAGISTCHWAGTPLCADVPHGETLS